MRSAGGGGGGLSGRGRGWGWPELSLLGPALPGDWSPSLHCPDISPHHPTHGYREPGRETPDRDVVLLVLVSINNKPGVRRFSC